MRWAPVVADSRAHACTCADMNPQAPLLSTPLLKVDPDVTFYARQRPSPAKAMVAHGAYFLHTGSHRRELNGRCEANLHVATKARRTAHSTAARPSVVLPTVPFISPLTCAGLPRGGGVPARECTAARHLHAAQRVLLQLYWRLARPLPEPADAQLLGSLVELDGRLAPPLERPGPAPPQRRLASLVAARQIAHATPCFLPSRRRPSGRTRCG